MSTTRRRARSAVLVVVLTLAGLLVGSVPAAAVPGTGSTVFINEIHYDNDGGDVGEALEIAGPAGTDLTGWQIVRYNGANGEVYGTDPLSGVLADQSGGYGFLTVSYPANGLQNGAPDGVALIDPAGVVVQFLSYEGSFAATAGPAAGETSTDIGVSESGSTLIGQSLQLTGSGSTAGDFTWAAAAASTFDAANNGQTLVGGPGGPADPVINEWGISDSGTDDEFVEIFGTPGTDYSAYTVLQIDGTAGQNGVIDHVVPVGATDGAGIWAATVPANSFENGDSTLLLVQDFTGADNDTLDTDGDGTLDVTPWTAVVDAVATDDPGQAGGVFYGVPVLDETFDDARFDSDFAPGGASRIPDGTDTDSAADWYRNDFSWDGVTNGSPEVGEALNTPGAPNQLATGPVPPILINEVDADQAGTDSAEFVELVDDGSGSTALDGLVLVLYNGSNDTSYRAFDLDGQATGADGYFVLCGNAATTANCDLDVTPDTNLIQNGADAVALYHGDGSDFPNGTAVTTDGLIDAVVYDTNDGDDAGLLALLVAGGQINEAENGDATVDSVSRCPDGSGTGRDATAFTTVTTTPGAANDCDGGGGPGDPVLIHEIQGSGPTVAISGPVQVQAVVISLFEDNDALDGFFIQEEDADADADPATSEGIFVFCRGACPAGLAVGDLVTVNGNATDFFGMSQIDASGFAGGSTNIDSSGNPLPAATVLSLPAAGRTDAEATYEAVEGMIVSYADTLAISEYFQLARFGQIVLTDEARPEQFTDANAPSVAGYAGFLDDLATRRIILDDNNNDQNDRTSAPLDNEPYAWPVAGLSTTNFFRGGDTITGLTGVMHWSFPGTGDNTWRLRPIDGQDYTFTSSNPRSPAPADVGGNLTVASFNVLNYFNTLDEPGAVCGPSALGCRGAHSAAELQRQKDKIVAALAEMNADIVGIIEVENDAGQSIGDLVSGLNAVLGAGKYDYVDTGTIGGDAIKVGLLYKPDVVTPVGNFAILDSSVDPTFIDDKNRPVLIQTFQLNGGQNGDGARLTVAVNHLKSKGSPCDDVGDPDANDGQGNCNGTRTDAAAALAAYLATDPTGSGDDDFLIIGDLNAYAMEDPITALEGAGYTDLVEQFVGPDAYTFVFDGQLGYLDHALANAALLPQITGVSTWHINADEVNLLDYNDDIQDANEASFERESNATDLYDPDAFRSSDHDPVLVGIKLATDEPVLECGSVSGTRADIEAAGYNVIVDDDSGSTIWGTNGRDFILGNGGDDRILGRRGADVICGGDGDDRIWSGFGSDEVFGDGDDDRIWTSLGNDTADGGDGNDVIRGSFGNDTVSGGAGDDSLFGDWGNDSLAGDDDDDAMNGGRGQDTCDGGDQVTGDTATACETVIDVP